MAVSGGASPATALDVLAGSQVDAAIAAGVAPDVAQQAGSAYTDTLVQLLGQGVSPVDAAARAQQVFQAEISLPVATPQQAMGSSLAGGGTASTPATALDGLATSQVNAAIAAGVAPDVAQQAGTAYTDALVQLLAQGVPLSDATARASQVFQAEASFPAATPQQAMGSSLASGGGDIATQLSSLSGAQTSAGSAAFDTALSSALAQGQSFTDAVQAAQTAAQSADAMAAADATPQSALASGSGAALAAVTSGSPAYQQALSDLLAQGVPLDQAVQRAGQVAQADAAGAAADAHSPAVALASGNPAALPQGLPGGSFDRALQAALARGLSIQDAMAQANAIDAYERSVAAAEARNVAYGFSSGSMLPPVVDAVFDQALANAIARGETPAAAIDIARQAAARNAAVTPSAATALASGDGNEVLIFLVGSSETFRMVLGNALARGVPIDKAIALAKRAELANAFRFRLPADIARQLPLRGTGVVILTRNGKPLPAWLAFSLHLREFVAVEVPAGGLPLPLVIRYGTHRFNVVVSEGPAPQEQARGTTRNAAYHPYKK